MGVSSKWRLFKKEMMELISFEEIASAAVTCKFIIRSRKIHPEEFLLTLLFGFYSKEEPSIAKLHRLYNSLVSPENRVVYSSFYERFTEDAEIFTDACLRSRLSKEISCVNSELKGYIRKFQDILIIDNTIVRVHPDFAEKYPATHTRRAAAGIKISVMLSVVGNGPRSVKLYPEKTNDAKTLNIGPWAKDRILLMDRGFFKFASFAKIDSYGGSFVTRLKSNTKAEIVSASLGIPEKVREKIAGLDIHDVIEKIKPIKLDIDANVRVKYYSGGKKKDKSALNLQFVAVYNEMTDDYHTYFTNIPESEFNGKNVAALYIARWDIENLFRETKSENLLGRHKSKNEHITNIFAIIPFMRLIISRKF
ncbi:MAG: IS4 family transposase [Euryarchaeota archaeon]|nr:IS4 family transposase [Euryarchaeota archaeon]